MLHYVNPVYALDYRPRHAKLTTTNLAVKCVRQKTLVFHYCRTNGHYSEYAIKVDLLLSLTTSFVNPTTIYCCCVWTCRITKASWWLVSRAGGCITPIN
jgi:hypothetical protein